MISLRDLRAWLLLKVLVDYEQNNGKPAATSHIFRRVTPQRDEDGNILVPGGGEGLLVDAWATLPEVDRYFPFAFKHQRQIAEAASLLRAAGYMIDRPQGGSRTLTRYRTTTAGTLAVMYLDEDWRTWPALATE